MKKSLLKIESQRARIQALSRRLATRPEQPKQALDEMARLLLKQSPGVKHLWSLRKGTAIGFAATSADRAAGFARFRGREFDLPGLKSKRLAC